MMNFIISFSNTRQFNLKKENQEFYSQIIIKHAEDYCFSMTVSGMIFYYFFWLLLLRILSLTILFWLPLLFFWNRILIFSVQRFSDFFYLIFISQI